MIEGAPGRFVGDRYHIVRELGRGGMGVVYLGRDLRLDMDVAIKFRGAIHSDATLWLKREFRSVASLRHPNLVELYELVAHDASCYFTMEYLPGIDPRRWVERPRIGIASVPPDPRATDQTTRSAPPLQEAHTEMTPSPHGAAPAPVTVRGTALVDFTRVRTVIAQLAEGLAFLHARGVIHRDVKPSNAIVVDGSVKLLDFGLALERKRQDEDLARETRIVGTAAYLAPEYVERLVVSPQIDVYALGVLAFELCTGSPPFGGTMHVLSRLRKSLKIPRASEANAEVPPDLDALIAAMLSPDPADRPAALDVAVRLSGNLSQPRPARRELSFIGREAEVERLAARIADPTPRGRLMLITGPSGAGKTTLIDEVVGRARTPELLNWRGRCHERERVPYRAFDSIIDDLATELAGDPRLAKEIEHAAALARVFPVLAPLIDPVLGDEPAAADLRVERERALLALVQMVRQLMTAPRAVVVIDDLHWADDDSLELLALLVDKIERPLTVVASWTTQGAAPARQALLDKLGGAAEVVDVPTMTDAEVLRVIAELAPRAPTERLAAAARLAAGSPYLAELIGRELGEADVADPHDAELRRLDRLTPPERTVAEITALAGGTASFEQLRALAELPSGRLQSVLRGLEDARIVRATPAVSGDPVYVFYHQRLRETAFAAMPGEARRALHQRFAGWFEATTSDAGQLAYHWHEAGNPTRAAHWAIVAGEAAQAQLAWGVASAWFARALTLGTDTPLVRGQLAECLFLGGKLAAAAEEFLTLARTDREGDRWRVRAAEAYLKLGELDRGLGLLDEVLARRGVHRAKNRVTSVVRAVSVAAHWMSPLPVKQRRVDDVLASAYRVIASFLSTPYPIESLEYVLRGVALAEASGDRAAHAMGMAMLAAYVATGSLGRFGDRAIANAQQLSAQSGAPYPRMVAAGASGMLATLRGNWEGMRSAHTEAESVCKRLGLERSWEASFLRTYWALGELYAGEAPRAGELLAGLTDTSEDLWTRAMLGSCRGRVLVLAGDLPAARLVAEQLARAPAARQGMSSIYRQVFLGELALAERDWSRARLVGNELARSARAQWLSTMPAISAMVDVITATADLGLAVAGDRSAAHSALATAKRLYRRGSSSFYAATALRIWGQAEALLGDHDASRATLGRAAAVAAQRGGKVDRLAISALTGARIEPGPLGSAVAWSTGGVIEA
ncbi:MAG: protein kinase [Myxococcales bacterium]|nr:protein kinase [Myxococcales bacterium]